jgi:5-methylcytosine-specific restriction endonuclease McrA
MSTLLLNADASPVSLLPLSTLCWQDAIKYLVSEKATVLEWYEDWIVRSERWSTRVPAVMILKEYQKKKSYVRFSKTNVFLRDNYICQYCEIVVTRKNATLDHVLPMSHGGKTTWDNCTTACTNCNARKGNNKKIKPKMVPSKPTYFQLIDNIKRMKADTPHPSWNYYLQ